MDVLINMVSECFYVCLIGRGELVCYFYVIDYVSKGWKVSFD